MGQYNIYADDDELNIDVNVEPLTLDTLENSKTAAEASAETARQCAETATEALNDITDYKNSLELYYAQASDNLTTLLNNSLASLNFCKQGIQTLGNTVLSSINSAYNSIVEYIQTLGQGYVNQAKYYADEARDTVDNGVSLEHLNQSKALETGDVSDDSAVLHQLNRFACSTFDNTKFTVVGSPVITDDGIASGFSSSNFLRTPTIDFSKPFEIIFEEKFITRPTGLYSNLLNIQGMTSGNNIGYYIQAKLASDSFAGIFNMVVNNTIHWEFIKFLWTGEQYKLYSKENANAGWVLRNTYDSTIPPSTANNTTTAVLVAGYNLNSAYSADGSIDLKQFSITIDGVEVFSGNKTGIDTIKPDDYTVVGTPTISADGIASGFSSSDYIQSSNQISFVAGQHWEIKEKVNLNSLQIGVFFQIFDGVYDHNSLQSELVSSGNVYWTCPTVPSGADDNRFLKFTSSFSFSNHLNEDVYLKWIYNGISYIFAWSLDDEQYTYETALTSNSQFTGSGVVRLAWRTPYDISFNGSIDLNAFKIYVDGNLVYQPCLKIPYTYAGNGKGYNASTGSKVVQSIYRDRVSDMYEQFGYAPYYTLSESDFTLPMGELYGMIENLRKLIIDRTT